MNSRRILGPIVPAAVERFTNAGFGVTSAEFLKVEHCRNSMNVYSGLKRTSIADARESTGNSILSAIALVVTVAPLSAAACSHKEKVPPEPSPRKAAVTPPHSPVDSSAPRFPASAREPVERAETTEHGYPDAPSAQRYKSVPKPNPRNSPFGRAEVPPSTSREEPKVKATLLEQYRLARQVIGAENQKACSVAVASQQRDGWNRAFSVSCQHKPDGLLIRSAGEDGRVGSGDDIIWRANPDEHFLVDPH